MKGIILAGGSGSRLYPITQAVNKHLLPVYDKPMIYYPLTTLMLANIRQILLIIRPEDKALYQAVVGDGSQWGIEIEYAYQAHPNGIAEALLIGEKFIDNSPVALILGDNIFFGPGFRATLLEASHHQQGATIFNYWVADPERFGVVEFDKNGQIKSIIEKPKNPPSNFAITGLYFYDAMAVELTKSLTPSPRGELEITDLNKEYLKLGLLQSIQLNRGFAWLDAGTHVDLLESGNYIATIEKRQGLKIGCPEEIAWRQSWISDDELLKCADNHKNSTYGAYLTKLHELEQPAKTDHTDTILPLGKNLAG